MRVGNWLVLYSIEEASAEFEEYKRFIVVVAVSPTEQLDENQKRNETGI